MLHTCRVCTHHRKVHVNTSNTRIPEVRAPNVPQNVSLMYNLHKTSISFVTPDQWQEDSGLSLTQLRVGLSSLFIASYTPEVSQSYFKRDPMANPTAFSLYSGQAKQRFRTCVFLGISTCWTYSYRWPWSLILPVSFHAHTRVNRKASNLSICNYSVSNVFYVIGDAIECLLLRGCN